MVKRTPRPEPAPAAEQASPAKPARNRAKKAPAAEAGDLTRAAMAEPAEGDRRHDDEHNIDVVYHKGKWVPAAPLKQPMTSTEASKPDKAPSGGWGDTKGISGVDKTEGVGWGLDGQQRTVDEEGNDASEAGKVAAAKAAPKGPKVRKSKKDEEGTNLTGMAKDLVNGVERIERLAEERSAIGDDIKEVFAELKSKGYSTPTLRKVLARRQMDPEKRKEQDDMLDLYEEALRGA